MVNSEDKYFNGIGDQLDLNFGGGGDVSFTPIPIDIAPPTITITPTPTNPSPDPVVVDYLVNYEIILTSNLQNEIGDLLSLEYRVGEGDNILDTDTITLADYNTDSKKLLKSLLTNSKLSLNIKGQFT